VASSLKFSCRGRVGFIDWLGSVTARANCHVIRPSPPALVTSNDARFGPVKVNSLTGASSEIGISVGAVLRGGRVGAAEERGNYDAASPETLEYLGFI
jgi:hypothetical protein